MEAVPEAWSSCATNSVTHGGQSGVGDLEEQSVCGSQGTGGGIQSDRFLQLIRCMSMNAFVSEQENFKFRKENKNEENQ